MNKPRTPRRTTAPGGKAATKPAPDPADAADKIRANPLVDRIAEALEKAIVAGEISPGERLSELALAATLGVSRAPLREAFRKLEGRRLVERSATGTVRVPSLSLEDLDQLLVVREALEGMACRYAAERMSADEIAALRAVAIEKKMELEGLGSVFHQNAEDHDFHAMIARGSGNTWLEAMLCQDLYSILRIYRYSAATLGQRATSAFDEHTAIIDAIEARDPDRAEAAMRAHNRNGRTNLLTILERDRSAPKAPFLRRLGPAKSNP